MTRVLNCTPTKELRTLRHELLKAHGCDVESPRTEQEAKQSLRRRPFDVLLLCYSFAPEAADRVCSEFRAHCPDGRVIAVTNERPRAPSCPPDVSVSTADAAALVREVVSSVPA